MDSNTLYYSLELVSGNGLRLSCEQKAALQTSLVILQRNYRFSRVLFWGKILGVKGDYFIAQGATEDELRGKKTLYSLNCIDWHLLPLPTPVLLAEVSAVAKGRFVGDPSFEYELTETRQQGEGDEAVKEEFTMKVTEEKRLAATVFNIERDVAVVPRGAFIRTPHDTVQVNRSFQGLSTLEAGNLSNYLHFTEPQHLKKKSIMEMADLDPSIDFLDPLSEDIPKACWSPRFAGREKGESEAVVGLSSGEPRKTTRFERSGSHGLLRTAAPTQSWSLQMEGSSVCVLRSLLWLGLTFFHVPFTPQHGYIYMGDGLKNLDLPFML